MTEFSLPGGRVFFDSRDGKTSCELGIAPPMQIKVEPDFYFGFDFWYPNFLGHRPMVQVEHYSSNPKYQHREGFMTVAAMHTLLSTCIHEARQ